MPPSPDASADTAPAQADSSPVAAPPAPQTPPFSDFPVDVDVLRALADMGYERPTAVQAAGLQPAIEGRDLLVQSKTGSGKTSAFGVPLLTRLPAEQAAPGAPLAVVLLPTRELAQQVAEEMSRLAAHKNTRVLAVYGGLPLQKQARALADGVEVVVATPGRLLDLLRRGHMNLDAIRMVVLDEADEMLSMGFWDDVTLLIKKTPADRQTLLFSATLPYEVAKSATAFMREPHRIDLSGGDLTVAGIDNRIVHVRDDIPKPRQMLYVLEGANAKSAIIFCNTRNETEMLSKYLTQSGFGAEPISGNLKQKERERTMARIKGGDLRYMVATDIAARGIDITDLSHVFNYALPEFSEVYVHRVGRTGRNGKVGMAVSLVDGRGLGTLSVLEKQFGIAFTEMTLPPEEDVLRARSVRIMQELLEKAGMAELSQHLPVAESIIGQAQAPQVVAYLLKAYFNGQALKKLPAAAEPTAVDDAEEKSAAPALASGEEEGGNDPQRRRRRRRGRGRGRAGEGEMEGGESESTQAAGPAQLNAAAASADADASSAPAFAADARGRNAPKRNFEVVDAIEWLGGMEALRGKEGAANEESEHGHRGDQGAGGSASGRPPRSRRGQQSNRQGQQPQQQQTSAEPRRAAEPRKAAEPAPQQEAALPDGQRRIRVNIGFNDGFKGRGAVAKRISALAGLNEGILTELDAKREHATLRASSEIAELVLDRVDGAQLGKKVIVVTLD